jgi:hypothetical protein
VAKNRHFANGRKLSARGHRPRNVPASGDPVLVGQLPGVALTANAPTAPRRSTRHGVYDLSVKGVDGGGNSAVAVGDIIYYVTADTPKLSKKATGCPLRLSRSAPSPPGRPATIPVASAPSRTCSTRVTASRSTRSASGRAQQRSTPMPEFIETIERSAPRKRRSTVGSSTATGRRRRCRGAVARHPGVHGAARRSGELHRRRPRRPPADVTPAGGDDDQRLPEPVRRHHRPPAPRPLPRRRPRRTATT